MTTCVTMGTGGVWRYLDWLANRGIQDGLSEAFFCVCAPIVLRINRDAAVWWCFSDRLITLILILQAAFNLIWVGLLLWADIRLFISLRCNE